MKKYLAVSVILLFIGLTIAPSINANFSKEALVEFTTEVCGFKGGKQSVKLTQEEAEEVENLFNSIRERLNATDSREEAEEIFKEAVVELDKYGLLGGLSVKQAKRLVTGNDYELKGFNDVIPYTINNRISNIFCLVNGNISVWNIKNLPSIPLYLSAAAFLYSMFTTSALFLNLLIVYPEYFVQALIWFLFFAFLTVLFLTTTVILMFNPISILNSFIMINESKTSNQWIRTNGLLGEKTIEGNMTGGIIGFNGLKIWLNDDIIYLLGFSMLISLSED